MDMKIYPGEEVHTPDTDVHIVNFGGSYSVNALYEKSAQNAYGTEAEKRAMPGTENVPPLICLQDRRIASRPALSRLRMVPRPFWIRFACSKVFRTFVILGRVVFR